MSDLHPRAQRFTIQTLVRYREVGGQTWFEGRIENVSCSGVFFRTYSVVKLKTAVQMSFDLPVSITGEGPGEVFCWGSVVRTVPPTDTKLSGVAATIRTYRLVHRCH